MIKNTPLSNNMIKKLPHFPDEDTPVQWICPPIAGRNILNNLFKYALKPRLQADGTWIINAKNNWRCFSKSHWLYTSADEAQNVLRANMQKHLQCSPILSEQRCVAIAPSFKNTWRLWQIVHQETTLAEYLAKALCEKQLEKLALEIFRCATYFADALLQSTRYPPLLNLSLENLGLDAELQLVYLGSVDEESSQTISESMLIDTIREAFTAPIAQALPKLDVAVIKEVEKIDGFDQQYLVEILSQLFRELGETL
jgi:hypothetical protein